MIPEAVLTAWSQRAPWPTLNQVEQDLVLSRLIIEVANDDHLVDELVFRGGTCLHKLVLDRPFRYSEDLDYVRTTAGGIAEVLRSIARVGERLGMTTSTQMSRQPKVYLRAPYESGTGQMRVKFEINTYERPSATALRRIPYSVESAWYSASARVPTFSVEELLATKVRALYQRSKGRDLFDFWLGLEQLGVRGEDIAEAFGPYRPDGYTSRLAIANLRKKLKNPAFRADLRGLASALPEEYDIDAAADRIIAEVLSRIP